MGMRVNPDLYSIILNGLSQGTKRQDNSMEQLATGQQLNSLSDNPAAVASLVGMRTQSSSNAQYLKNISTLTGTLQVADSALSSVVESLTSAVSLGVEGANGTLSAENRQAIAQQVQGIQQQVLGLANTSYDGNYLFAGTATNGPAYVSDSNANSGVNYNGNPNVNTVGISLGQTMQANLPGSQLFSNSAGDVFQSLQDLYTALQNGGDVASATTEVRRALDVVDNQRTFYGNSLNRLSSSQTYLNSEQTQLTTAESNTLDADMAKTITDLTQSETTRDALLQATGKIPVNTLFDYLPSS
jgi:flagellar hook-associated protein 3 FlgL